MKNQKYKNEKWKNDKFTNIILEMCHLPLTDYQKLNFK